MNYYFPFRSVCRHIRLKQLNKHFISKNQVKTQLKIIQKRQSCRAVALFDLNFFLFGCVLLYEQIEQLYCEPQLHAVYTSVHQNALNITLKADTKPGCLVRHSNTFLNGQMILRAKY